MILFEGYSICGTLRIGSTGKCVELMQSQLSGILSKLGIKVDVTGIFDSKTAELVKFFQKSQGIGVDGIVGPITWSRLDSEFAKIYGQESLNRLKSLYIARPETITKPKAPEQLKPAEPVKAGLPTIGINTLLILSGLALILFASGIFEKKEVS